LDEDILARVDLFSTLSKRELQALAKSCHERTYPAGTKLFSQNDVGAGLYILKRGKVKIMQAGDPDRAEVELGTAGPGEIFGEMSLLDDLPRSATVIAVEDTTAQLLPVWEFRNLLRNHPDISLKLLAVLSRRLRKAEQRSHDR
jgi:CRP/FNR family cyclic AMP-dependent transcriptional regulator